MRETSRALVTRRANSDFFCDITGRFDLAHTGLVTFGEAVPPDRKAELKQLIAAINPNVTFLDGLAGIPGLIINQIEAAFTAGHQGHARAPAYAPGDRSIRLTLAVPAAVKVTVWWWTSVIPPDPEANRSSCSTTGSPAATTRLPSPPTSRPWPRRQAGHGRPPGSPPRKPVR
jgi:hypothetical protein